MAHAEDAPRSRSVSGFPVVRQGYDRTQVKRLVQQFEAELQQAAAERDRALEQAAELAGQVELARREIEALTERLDTFERRAAAGGGAESAARALDVARSAAADITARAQAVAEHAWAAAKQVSDELQDQYRRLLEKVEQQHAEVRAAHDQIMVSARSRADELTVAAERRRQEIDDAAERDRMRIEREFDESMSARRSALDREIEATRAASLQEAEQRIRDVDAEAARRVASAAAEVDRLTTLRDELAKQLRGTQQVLDQIMSALQPTDTEPELVPDEDLQPFPAPHTEPVPPPRVPSRTDEPASNAP